MPGTATAGVPARCAPSRGRLVPAVRMVAVAVGGGLTVAVGLVLVPLPGPGWAVVFVGLALLGQEFPWAARLSDALRRRLKAATHWLRRAVRPDGPLVGRHRRGRSRRQGRIREVTTTAAPPGSSPPSARLGSPWSSAPLTLATLVVMLVAVALREGSGGGFTSPGWPLLAFTVLAWLPLTVRTRWPLPVLAATVVVHAAQLLLLPQIDPGLTTQGMGAYQPVPVATMVAAFTAAVRVPRRTAWRAGVVASLLLPLAAIIGQPDDQLLTDLVMCNLVLDGTALGALVAGRRDRLSQEARQRAEDTRRAVEAERLRIAAELHDVLAHHLTLVNAQVGVAGYLLSSDPQAAGTALEGLAEHTRQALDELRATVGLLRRDDADGHDTGRSPVPGLDRLPDLLAAVRAAGTAVEIRTDGDPRSLPAAGDHAAYRIVQESLTNATKHAPGTRVTLLLDWTDGAVLRLRVDNAPPPRPSSPGPGTSHGLIGMSERARAAGGTVTAGPAPDGGYVVTAALPTATPEKP